MTQEIVTLHPEANIRVTREVVGSVKGQFTIADLSPTQGQKSHFKSGQS